MVGDPTRVLFHHIKKKAGFQLKKKKKASHFTEEGE